MICSAAQSASLAGQVVAALAMHVEHEAADRHGGVAAIVHQLVPVAIAQLGDVQAEGLEQVLRVLRRQAAARPAPRAARTPSGSASLLPEQRRLQAVEQLELFARRQASGDRRCRRRCARNRRRPGSAGGAARRSAARRRENSRPDGPCRCAGRRHASSRDSPRAGLDAALPHAAASARVLAGGLEREGSVERARSPAAPGPRAARDDRSASVGWKAERHRRARRAGPASAPCRRRTARAAGAAR